jgi:plasmid maintenance system antidote protein VapI
MAVGDLTATDVATLAGVSPRMATTLLTGHAGRPLRRISPDTARSLLRVTAADARAVRARQVPAEESRLRLRRLLARASGVAGLAEQLGVSAGAVSALADGTSGWCSALLALRLLAIARAATPGALPVEPAVRAAA